MSGTATPNLHYDLLVSDKTETMAKAKVLVVEDDKALSDVLVFNLEKEGFNVFQAFDGRAALELARLKKPDVVMLDVMLPLIDGLDVCRQLRKFEETKHAGILMVTCKGQEMEQIGGFEAGADDYVTKPYSVTVLMQRVHALCRRRSDEGDEPTVELLSVAGVTVDLRRYRVTVDGEPIELTRSEFKLLTKLISKPGQAYERSELIESALGEDTLVLERTIDVHIRAIRRKMGDRADLIETVRGVGYRFSEAEEPSGTPASE